MIKKFKFTKWSWFVFFTGLFACAILLFASNNALHVTSTDEYCQSCHIHPDADASWKKSTHYYNPSGVRVHCVECHLPPKEDNRYLLIKAKTGLKDIYGFYFKDSTSFDWENKRLLEHAVKIVYNESCIRCHQNLFSKGLSAEGGTAHLYYENNAEKLNLQCINCHLDVGHYNANYKHGKMTGVPVTGASSKIYIQLLLQLPLLKTIRNSFPTVPSHLIWSL